jgi:hypothetical protein
MELLVPERECPTFFTSFANDGLHLHHKQNLTYLCVSLVI